MQELFIMAEQKFDEKELYSGIKKIMQLIIMHFYKNMSFLTVISNRLSNPDQALTKETMAIIWSIYNVNNITDSLLDIKDDKRAIILGHRHRTEQIY